MDEKVIFQKLAKLKELKADLDFKENLKERILVYRQEKEVPSFSISIFYKTIFQYPKLRYATLTLLSLFVILLISLLAFKNLSQNKNSLVFNSSDSFQLKSELQLAKERIEEIYRLAQENKSKKELEGAIKEYEATTQKIARQISKEKIKDLPSAQELVLGVKTLTHKEAKVEKALSAKIEGGEKILPLANEVYYKNLAYQLLGDFEGVRLSKEKASLFEKAKDLMATGKYEQAVLLFLELSS